MQLGNNSDFQYTSKNYLRYTVKGSVGGPESEFSVNMGKFDSSNLDFRSHCIDAANQICEMYPCPYLAFSGGIDSQAVLFSFLETGRPFKLVVFRYIDPQTGNVFNANDYFFALNILKELNLLNRLEVIDVDLDSFYSSQLHDIYADKYKCSSPQFTVHMHALSLLNEPAILSWNIPNLYRTNNHNKIFFPNYKHFCFHRFFAENKRPGVAFFFLFKPEQFYSALLLPSINSLFYKSLENNYIMPYEVKIQAYHEAGFRVQRQPQKATGFEDYKEHYMHLKESTRADQYEIDLRRPYEKKFFFKSTHCELDSNFFRKYLR